MLRSLRPYLQAQSQEHHTIDRCRDGSIESGSDGRSTLERQEKDIVSQTDLEFKKSLEELIASVLKR